MQSTWTWIMGQEYNCWYWETGKGLSWRTRIELLREVKAGPVAELTGCYTGMVGLESRLDVQLSLDTREAP